MNNIPQVKLGIVAVSRDCFPITLSEKRRKAVVASLAAKGCEIYECSYGGVQMGNTSGIKIENCSFRDLGGDALYFYECRDVVVDGKQVSGNARLSY